MLHIKHWIKCILFPLACDPACVRGTCTEDRVCVCPEGWTGEDCNIPGMNIKSNVDCHHNSHIDGPSACKGTKSWPYYYAVCDPVCVRGTCTEDMVCTCPDGWIGEDCNTPSKWTVMIIDITSCGMEHNDQCSLSCEIPALSWSIISATCLVFTLKGMQTYFRGNLAINRGLDYQGTY